MARTAATVARVQKAAKAMEKKPEKPKPKPKMETELKKKDIKKEDPYFVQEEYQVCANVGCLFILSVFSVFCLTARVFHCRMLLLFVDLLILSSFFLFLHSILLCRRKRGPLDCKDKLKPCLRQRYSH